LRLVKEEEIAQAVAGFALLADHQVRHWLVSFQLLCQAAYRSTNIAAA